MTDAPERIWIDGGPSPDNEWFAEPASGHDEVEYIRADLVPQPQQEPTPEAVERAAIAHHRTWDAVSEIGIGGWKAWEELDESQRAFLRRAARAALRAALTAPA